MKPIEKMPKAVKKNIRYVLADIDDTLTLDGRLPAVVFAAMEDLKKANIYMGKTALFISITMIGSAKCGGAILYQKNNAVLIAKNWKNSNGRF
jgi:hypothetical protein